MVKEEMVTRIQPGVCTDLRPQGDYQRLLRNRSISMRHFFLIGNLLPSLTESLSMAMAY
jgi:hypothetical protein